MVLDLVVPALDRLLPAHLELGVVTPHAEDVLAVLLLRTVLHHVLSGNRLCPLLTVFTHLEPQTDSGEHDAILGKLDVLPRVECTEF